MNVMDLPCAVVPFHWPTLFDEEDGDAGPSLHAEASPPASVPTSITAFVRVHISGLQRLPVSRSHRAQERCTVPTCTACESQVG